MERIACTVFFEDPFWVAVFERTGADGCYSAAKTTFGAEPKSFEVLAFVLERYGNLVFSDPAEAEAARPLAPAGNPKRMQRKAARATAETGVGTKAQQALKAQYEAGKQARKVQTRQEREALARQKFLLSREKKKARRRGR